MEKRYFANNYEKVILRKFMELNKVKVYKLRPSQFIQGEFSEILNNCDNFMAGRYLSRFFLKGSLLKNFNTWI